MNRRRLLARASAVGAVAVAGCTGTRRTGDRERSSTTTTTETTTSTAAPTTSTTTSVHRDTTTTSTTTTAVAATVTVQNASFDPVRVRVDPGSNVRWRFEGGEEHTLTAARFHDGAADWELSVELDPRGHVVVWRFEDPGIHEYYCTVHGRGTTCGAILVGDVALDDPLPCE